LIAEVFTEWEFGDAAIARQQRDARCAALQGQGFICISENLYRVDGQRVYLLTATPPGSPDVVTENPKTRGDRPGRSGSKFETR
jgi:hypothetical protein